MRKGLQQIVPIAILITFVGAAAASAQDTLRWELITDGSSEVGRGQESSPDAPVPNLGGANATFLFRLDLEPMLNYRNGNDAAGHRNAKASHHFKIETGIVPVGRAITAQASAALSEVTETLRNQGVTVTGDPVPAATLTRQRAFTTAFEYSANALIDADGEGEGAFAELGLFAKGRFDAFLENERLFENDGITYLKVGAPGGGDSGYFGAELGFRARLSQFEEEAAAKRDAAGNVVEIDGGNPADLLVFELLYQRANPLKGLVAGSASENRLVMRFMATPYLSPGDPEDAKKTKFVIGVEMNRDWQGKGRKDIRLLYGVDLDIESLFGF